MNVRTGLWMVIAGSVGTMLIAAARQPEPPEPPAPRRHHQKERAWLTHEAMRELVGEGGVPGPLFAGLTLGGVAPTPEDRARIGAWATNNGVEIHFDVADDELAAIRFSVEFGGCCGYEGADALARQLARIQPMLVVQAATTDPDTWNRVIHDIAIHVHLDVNRVEARWERELSIAELLDRAESLLGKTRAQLRAQLGSRLEEVEPGAYLVAEPYPFDSPFVQGIELTVEHGVVTRVAVNPHFSNQNEDEHQLLEQLAAITTKRWGRPVESLYLRTWNKPDRAITSDTAPWDPVVTIARR